MRYEYREKIFNFIMVQIRKYLYLLLKLDIHRKYEKNTDITGYFPVLSYNLNKKTYRFNCYCFDCPCNFNGLCSTRFYKIPINCLHEFDGDNIVKNYCG